MNVTQHTSNGRNLFFKRIERSALTEQNRTDKQRSQQGEPSEDEREKKKPR